MDNESSVSKVYEDTGKSKTIFGGESRRSKSKIGNLLKQSR